MGVKYLQSFMTAFVPDGTSNINIKEQINEFRNKNNVNAVIVIDFNGFTKYWQSPEEIICGYRGKQYVARAKNFFEELKKAGAEIIFFKDGPREKRITWSTRQDIWYKELIPFFNEIQNRSPVNELIKLLGDIYSTSIGSLLKFVAKEVGSFRTSPNNECDRDIAAFACKNNALAVMTDDTDFLIYPGEWSVWSVKKLNVETFDTVQFNKSALRRQLDLTNHQLPLFASLCGNDIILHECLKSFHNTMDHSNDLKVKFNNIAAFVRNFYNQYTNKDMAVVSKQVFNSEDYAPKLKLSLDSYDINKTKFTGGLDEEDSINTVRKLFPMYIPAQFDDMRLCAKSSSHSDDVRLCTKSASYSVLDLMLKRRHLGLLLDDQKDKDLRQIVYFKRSHYHRYEKISVSLDYPSEHDVPTLNDVNEVNNGNTSRHKILEWLHFDAFDSKVLFEQPDDFILLLATLSLLIKEWDMTESEAAFFVICYNDVLHDRVPDTLECPKILHPRAFRLVQMVLRVLEIVHKGMVITGISNKVLKPFLFDGIYFHTEYIKWMKMSGKQKFQRKEEVKHLTTVFRK